MDIAANERQQKRRKSKDGSRNQLNVKANGDENKPSLKLAFWKVLKHGYSEMDQEKERRQYQTQEQEQNTPATETFQIWRNGISNNFTSLHLEKLGGMSKFIDTYKTDSRRNGKIWKVRCAVKKLKMKFKVIPQENSLSEWLPWWVLLNT